MVAPIGRESAGPGEIPDHGPHSAADAYVALLGLELREWADGRAVVELMVRPHHLNAIGRLHGGALFSLADAAVARASNTDADAWVVTTAQMSFLRASRPGDVLTAVATADHRGSRLGSYRVDVTCAGRLVATASAQAMRAAPGVSGSAGNR